LIHKIQKTLSARKDVDPLVYSAFYEFSMAFYNQKLKYKQPSLVSLKNSAESWMYELLEIFNKGDIVRYERFDLSRNVFNL
jgi:hypothetical protein